MYDIDYKIPNKEINKTLSNGVWYEVKMTPNHYIQIECCDIIPQNLSMECRLCQNSF